MAVFISVFAGIAIGISIGLVVQSGRIRELESIIRMNGAPEVCDDCRAAVCSDCSCGCHEERVRWAVEAINKAMPRG